MKIRFQPWQLAILMMLICVGVVGLVHWARASKVYDAAALLQTLPEDRTVHLFVDVEMLRQTGFLDVLTGSKVPEEADYTKFVDDTGFDYRTDLNAIAVGFNQGAVYMAVRGQFEWNRLTAYARAQGGQCQNSVCTMKGSTPERNISFYPLRPDVLALAVAKDTRGIDVIYPRRWKTPRTVPPTSAVWVSAPGTSFADVTALPAGTHSFLSPLSKSSSAMFTLGQGPHGGGGFELRLDAACTSQDAAESIAKQLAGTTDLLRSMLVRDHLKASPADLSGVLSEGSFQAKNDHMEGIWPLDRQFVDNLLSGKLQ